LASRPLAARAAPPRATKRARKAHARAPRRLGHQRRVCQRADAGPSGVRVVVLKSHLRPAGFLWILWREDVLSSAQSGATTSCCGRQSAAAAAAAAGLTTTRLPFATHRETPAPGTYTCGTRSLGSPARRR